MASPRRSTYDVGPDPTGLTVADVRHDGKLDLLVGNAYGDVLVLLGNGDGTFQPYHEADQTMALAVADLTGTAPRTSSTPTRAWTTWSSITAGASRPCWETVYGPARPRRRQLADLNGDGIPDLIVANSGGNNVLVYPGLGNGQFGPAVNGGHGFFTGTDPVGITVADAQRRRPARPGGRRQGLQRRSQSCSTSRQGGGSFTFVPGPRLNRPAPAPVVPRSSATSPRRQPRHPGQQQRLEQRRAAPGRRRRVLQRPEPQTLPVGNSPARSSSATSTASPTF